MLSRAQILVMVPMAIALASCANYPLSSTDALPSSNTGMTFNTLRGKIYFGPETTIRPVAAESSRLLVIAPNAVPFMGQEPILLATGQDGAVTIRTDYTVISKSSDPDLFSMSALLDYPQCPLAQSPVSAGLPLLSALQLDTGLIVRARQ